MIGIIAYDSKSITTNGKKKFYPFYPLDKSLEVIKVSSNKKTKLAHWAVIKDKSIQEILGPVHQLDVERMALLRHYQILPRRYPKVSLNPIEIDFKDLTHHNAFSLDDESTQDVDDCISVEVISPSEYIIWVYIAFIGFQFTPESPLGIHALRHNASVYAPNKEYPLFHRDLSHRDFSLLEGEVRPVIALKIHITSEKKTLQYCFAKIKNQNKSTYQAYDKIDTPEKNILQDYTGENSSKDIIAKLMIEYNQYFGNLIKGIIRVQKPDLPAKYVLSKEDTIHSSLGLSNYTHATSPIRRVVDLINQWCLLDPSRITYFSTHLEEINSHSNEIKRCHRNLDLLELVYLTKFQEVTVQVKILEKRSDSFWAEIEFEDKTLRIWFPITDSLIMDLSEFEISDKFEAILCGYHRKGFPKLRLKLN